MAIEKKRVDEEWKRRAEEEKKKIEQSMRKDRGPAGGATAGRAAAADGGGARAPHDPMGRSSFMTLLSQLAAQAMAGLGQLEDPRTGQRTLDLDLARDGIDLLATLEEKTRGNLTADEEAVLGDLLQNLRMAYVSATRAASQPPPETRT